MLVHTGQHYDQSMSRLLFDQLKLPRPDLDLGSDRGRMPRRAGRIMVEVDTKHLVVDTEPEFLVVVVGDVNSTLAGAIVAPKAGLPVAHVEAGLRSRDRTMPEEINRIVTRLDRRPTSSRPVRTPTTTCAPEACRRRDPFVGNT